MDGKSYYDAAVRLTDLHDKRFCDMMVEDFRGSKVERNYFMGDDRKLELMGWATFCRKMEEAGQGEWLAKIEALDEEVLLRVLSKKLIDASNKEEADGALKALQGLLSRRKMKTDTDATASGGQTTLNVYVTGIGGRGEEDK